MSVNFLWEGLSYRVFSVEGLSNKTFIFNVHRKTVWVLFYIVSVTLRLHICHRGDSSTTQAVLMLRPCCTGLLMTERGVETVYELLQQVTWEYVIQKDLQTHCSVRLPRVTTALATDSLFIDKCILSTLLNLPALKNCTSAQKHAVWKQALHLYTIFFVCFFFLSRSHCKFQESGKMNENNKGPYPD